MQLRLATANDQPVIMEIINGAITALKQAGSPQWQNGYPNERVVAADINREDGIVLIHNHKIVGYAALVTGPDPNYLHIDGQWLTAGTNYCAIHRVALARSVRGQGMATPFLKLLVNRARQNGYHSVRIDTHRLNLPMQRTAVSAGFTQCGIIQIIDEPTDPDRIAYEQFLTPTNNH